MLLGDKSELITAGWTSRELRRILHSLVGLNIVAVDVVELAPAYDTNGEWRLSFVQPLITVAEISAIAAADMVYDFMTLLALGVDKPAGSGARQVDEL